jgi:hypothetical protein
LSVWQISSLKSRYCINLEKKSENDRNRSRARLRRRVAPSVEVKFRKHIKYVRNVECITRVWTRVYSEAVPSMRQVSEVAIRHAIKDHCIARLFFLEALRKRCVSTSKISYTSSLVHLLINWILKLTEQSITFVTIITNE